MHHRSTTSPSLRHSTFPLQLPHSSTALSAIAAAQCSPPSATAPSTTPCLRRRSHPSLQEQQLPSAHLSGYQLDGEPDHGWQQQQVVKDAKDLRSNGRVSRGHRFFRVLGTTIFLAFRQKAALQDAKEFWLCHMDWRLACPTWHTATCTASSHQTTSRVSNLAIGPRLVHRVVTARLASVSWLTGMKSGIRSRGDSAYASTCRRCRASSSWASGVRLA